MLVLGISEIDNDAGAVLLDGAQVVAGINEERLSRKKRHRGFPHRSIAWLLEHAGVTLGELDAIAVAKADPSANPGRFYRQRHRMAAHRFYDRADPAPGWSQGLNHALYRLRNDRRSAALAAEMSGEIRSWAAARGVTDKLVRVPHHRSHAACAYWASGFEQALAVTLDGQGEGSSSEVYAVRGGRFELLSEVSVPSSLGTFYAAATKALGFTPNRHEGKLTGLAAYARPAPALLAQVRRLAYVDRPGSFAAPSIYGAYPLIKLLARRFGREQLAAAFQQVLEEVAVDYVSHWVQRTGISDLVLAGGVVANVKLNQRLAQIPGVERIFVFPHMADGGLGYGAAQIVYRGRSKDLRPSPIRDVYWGPAYDEAAIERAASRCGLDLRRPPDLADAVAQRLERNRVIARFDGRMEFGPRALGNRSILYPTVDPAVNDWLNTRLDRSEFMPFAPVTLASEASAAYEDIGGAARAAQYMTVTFDCSPDMQRRCPAVVHVDGTARPQLLEAQTNPGYHAILSAYHRRTGLHSLVNTSFNMHEEPTVCTPEDAMRAFLRGGLDGLAIGPFLIDKPGSVVGEQAKWDDSPRPSGREEG